MTSKDDEFKGAVHHHLLVVTEKNRFQMAYRNFMYDIDIADDRTSIYI
jgi:hypothetical protein